MSKEVFDTLVGLYEVQIKTYAEMLWKIVSKTKCKPYNQLTPAEKEADKAFSEITREIRVNDDKTITYSVIGGTFTSAPT